MMCVYLIKSPLIEAYTTVYYISVVAYVLQMLNFFGIKLVFAFCAVASLPVHCNSKPFSLIPLTILI